MASSYKFLGNNDRVVSTTNLVEQIEHLSGANLAVYNKTTFAKIHSGSNTGVNLFDITVGRSSDITSGSSALDDQKMIYNQMAKLLLGTNIDSSILKFSLDSDNLTNNNILHNAIFVNFSRNQFKDKIKKGSFELLVNVTGTTNVYLTDLSGAMTEPVVRECQTGEYGLLFVSSSSDTGLSIATDKSNLTGGLVFYEAGLAVISPYIFAKSGTFAEPTSSTDNFNENQRGLLGAAGDYSGSGTTSTVGYAFVSGTIFNGAYGMFSNIVTASYQSITELNSTIYFCRAFNNEFNYSSNPTYLDQSQILVKEGDPMAQPLSYITTVGLYDDNNQLLAVAKLSEPIKKTPDTELIARVRLDF